MKLANFTSRIRARLIAKSFNRELVTGSEILDIGCGTGVVLKELANIFPFKKMMGCDIENYLITDIPFKIQKDSSILPFKNNQFDIAMFNDVLHHIPFEEQKILINESVRVSKKVIIFELLPKPINKLGDYLLNKIHNPNMYIPFTYRTVSGWKNVFSKDGISCKVVAVNKPLLYPFDHVGFILSR